MADPAADPNQALKDGLLELIQQAVQAAERVNTYGQHAQHYSAFSALKTSAEQMAANAERVGLAIAAIIEAERPVEPATPLSAADFPFEHRDTHAEMERFIADDAIGFSPNPTPHHIPYEPEERSNLVAS